MRDAVVVVVESDGRFLMVKRSETVIAPGFWVPPSGRVEPGETQSQAVRREMHEELELNVEPLRKVWECPTEDGSMLLHWWEAEAIGVVGRIDEAEVAQVRWCTVAEIAKLSPVFDEDVRFFEEIRPGLDRS